MSECTAAGSLDGTLPRPLGEDDSESIVRGLRSQASLARRAREAAAWDPRGQELRLILALAFLMILARLGIVSAQERDARPPQQGHAEGADRGVGPQ